MRLFILFLGFVALGVGKACVLPRGITDSSGDGGLDLATIQDTLSMEPFDFTNPIISTVAACAGGLETPISMRTLLGKMLKIRGCSASPVACGMLKSVFSFFSLCGRKRYAAEYLSETYPHI